MNLNQQIEQLALMIATSEHLVAFTGAGISTDSGLPPPAWCRDPSRVEPNAAHFALVDLLEMGKLQFLISQNVDGLHMESGIPIDRLAELHGNGKLMRCLSCEARFTHEQAGWDESRWGEGFRTQPVRRGQPKCAQCGGRLISSIVNFGDPLPEEELSEAVEHSRQCDVFLAIGSSLVVSPANLMPQLAVASGARLVLINQGETPLDDLADLRIWSGIGEVLPAAVKRTQALMRRKWLRMAG